MNNITLVVSNFETVYVEATEAPEVATNTVETKKQSPTTKISASKKRRNKPKVITVSVDNTTICSDDDGAPPEGQTEQPPEPKPEPKAKQKSEGTNNKTT